MAWRSTAACCTHALPCPGAPPPPPPPPCLRASLESDKRAHSLVDGDVAPHAVDLKERAQLTARAQSSRGGATRSGGRHATDGGGPGQTCRLLPHPAAAPSGSSGGAAAQRQQQQQHESSGGAAPHLIFSLSSRDTCTLGSRSRAFCSLCRSSSWAGWTARADGGVGARVRFTLCRKLVCSSLVRYPVHHMAVRCATSSATSPRSLHSTHVRQARQAAFERGRESRMGAATGAGCLHVA